MKIVDKLRNVGFCVDEYLESSKREISNNLYNIIPKDYLEFLKSFESIHNPEETVWFNSINDFNEKSNSDFKWNEFENLSREWSEDDEEELKIIDKFWNEHIPILMSVKNQYEFLAINITKSNYGKIFHGKEPEFENVSEYCKDFNELISLFEKSEIKRYWIENE